MTLNVVPKSDKIADDVMKAANVIISESVSIDRGTRIEAGVSFAGENVIGEHNGIRRDVYFGYGARTGKIVKIGDASRIGGCVVIGDHCTLLGRVDIGTSAVIGHDTLIYDGALILADAEIGPHVEIGSGCVVGQGARVPLGATIPRRERWEDIDHFSLDGRHDHTWFVSRNIAANRPWTLKAGCRQFTMNADGMFHGARAHWTRHTRRLDVVRFLPVVEAMCLAYARARKLKRGR